MTLNIRKINNLFYITSNFNFNNTVDCATQPKFIAVNINKCDAFNMWLHSGYYKEQVYPEKHENNTKYVLCRVIETIKYIDSDVKLYYSYNKNTLNIEDALIFKDEFLHDNKPLGTIIIDSDIIDIALFYSMLKGEDTILILAEYQGINYCIKNLIIKSGFAEFTNDYYKIKGDFNKSLSTLGETDYAKKYVEINEKYMKLRTLKSMRDKFNMVIDNIVETIENNNDFSINELINNIDYFIVKYKNVDNNNVEVEIEDEDENEYKDEDKYKDEDEYKDDSNNDENVIVEDDDEYNDDEYNDVD